MTQIVDLPRYRRACAALDQLVSDHPELRQGGGRWSDNLEELDSMTKPMNARMQAYRDRLRDRGMKQVAMLLSPADTKRLDSLREKYPDMTIGEIVGAALNDPDLEGRLSE